MVITPKVRKLLTLNERNHSLYIGDEDNFVFVADLGQVKDDRHLFFFVSFALPNYPALNTSFWETTVEEVRQQLQRDLVGWYARKNALGLQLDEDGNVAEVEDEDDDEEALDDEETEEA